jgi:hypothetical protein
MILLLEGWDAYDTGILPAASKWDTFTGVVIQADAGRSGYTGDNAAAFDTRLASTIATTVSFAANPDTGVITATMGFAIQVTRVDNVATLAKIATTLSTFELRLNSLGQLFLIQVSGFVELGAVVTTARGVVPIGTGGTYVEFQVVFDAANPSACQVRLADQYGEMNVVGAGPLLAFYPPDDIPDNIILGGGLAEAVATWLVDDVYVTDGRRAATPVVQDGLYIWNDGFLGNTNIITFYPTADGVGQAVNNTPWVPDTGTIVFVRIDEHPPDEDTSYIHSEESGERSTCLYQSPRLQVFGMINCEAAALIYGLQWDGRLRTAGDAGSVSPVIRQVVTGDWTGDIVVNGPLRVVDNEEYEYKPAVLERDPTRNNAPWTFAIFHPAGVGVPGTTEFGVVQRS